MTQSVTGTRAALFAVCQTLYTGQNTLVSWGPPGEFQPDLIVAVMGARVPITRPTMGTGRSREQSCEITVVFSQYVHGGPEASQPAETAAWAAADQLEAYFRTKPNEELGGACRDAWVSAKDIADPEIAWEPTGDGTSSAAVGRVATVTVTVTAAVRI